MYLNNWMLNGGQKLDKQVIGAELKKNTTSNNITG